VSLAERALIGRVAAVAILVALALILWLGPVDSYLDLIGDTAQNLALAEQKLVRYRALAAPTTEPATPVAEATILLPAVSDAQAAALLQETIKSAASAAQVQIEGIQVLQPESSAGTSRVGVRLRGRGDLAGLDRLLYAIEASRPLLHPDNLQIRARTTLPSAAPTLDFQLEVLGFKPGPPA
jgi:general secretion pathway protein M